MVAGYLKIYITKKYCTVAIHMYTCTCCNDTQTTTLVMLLMYTRYRMSILKVGMQSLYIRNCMSIIKVSKIFYFKNCNLCYIDLKNDLFMI